MANQKVWNLVFAATEPYKKNRLNDSTIHRTNVNYLSKCTCAGHQNSMLSPCLCDTLQAQFLENEIVNICVSKSYTLLCAIIHLRCTYKPLEFSICRYRVLSKMNISRLKNPQRWYQLLHKMHWCWLPETTWSPCFCCMLQSSFS